MIRSVSIFARLGLAPALVCVCSTAALAREMQSDAKSSTGYSMAPSGPGDRFVAGKYDKSGTYIPPHYQAVAKPAFHGYFFKRSEPGYNGMNSGATNKNHLDSTPPGSPGGG